jgi:hypothetical protein
VRMERRLLDAAEPDQFAARLREEWNGR